MFLKFKQWINEGHTVEGGFVNTNNIDPSIYEIIDLLASPNPLYPDGMPFIRTKRSGAPGDYVFRNDDFVKIHNQVGEKVSEIQKRRKLLQKNAKDNPRAAVLLDDLESKYKGFFTQLKSQFEKFTNFANDAISQENAKKLYKSKSPDNLTGFLDLGKYHPQVEEFLKEFTPFNNSYSYIKLPAGSRQGRDKYSLEGLELKNLLQNFTHVLTPMQNNKEGLQKQKEHEKYLVAINKFINDDRMDRKTISVDLSPNLK